MLENIRLAFRGIWSHKMRSFLTMLGIIIGIASIISIASTIQGTNEQIKQNLVGAGNNAVTVQLYQDEWTYEMDYNGIPDGVPVISDDTMQQIPMNRKNRFAVLRGLRMRLFITAEGMRTESPIGTPAWTVEVCMVWMRSF